MLKKTIEDQYTCTAVCLKGESQCLDVIHTHSLYGASEGLISNTIRKVETNRCDRLSAGTETILLNIYKGGHALSSSAAYASTHTDSSFFTTIYAQHWQTDRQIKISWKVSHCFKESNLSQSTADFKRQQQAEQTADLRRHEHIQYKASTDSCVI